MDFIFWNSNLLLSVTTIFVGIVAYFVYWKQKRDEKRDAANIILMEIRNAERVIGEVKIDISGNILKARIFSLVPNNSWLRYNYLFVNDLDRDEIDLINKFYNQCKNIDSSLKQLLISRQIDYKGRYIQKELCGIAYKACKNDDSIDEVQKRYESIKTKFTQLIDAEPYVFNPESPKTMINAALSDLPIVTTSSAGDKLKKLAKIK